MENLKKGDYVQVSFKGVVGGPSSVPSRFTYVYPAAGTTSSSIRVDNQCMTIEKIQAPFDPKPGQVYILAPKSHPQTIRAPWFVTKTEGVIKMVSESGVYSIGLFREAYLNDSWTIEKAEIQ